MMNTFDYEDSLFMIDPTLRELRDLKELYISFNNRNVGKPMDARIELDRLIDRYLHCGNPMFYDFACLLIKNHAYIINLVNNHIFHLCRILTINSKFHTLLLSFQHNMQLHDYGFPKVLGCTFRLLAIISLPFVLSVTY